MLGMRLLLTIFAALVACDLGQAQTAALFSGTSAGPVGFAATEIRNAQTAKGGRLAELGLDSLRDLCVRRVRKTNYGVALGPASATPATSKGMGLPYLMMPSLRRICSKFSRVINTPSVRVSAGGCTPYLIH